MASLRCRLAGHPPAPAGAAGAVQLGGGRLWPVGVISTSSQVGPLENGKTSLMILITVMMTSPRALILFLIIIISYTRDISVYSSQQPCEVGAVIISTLLIRRPRFREAG